MNAPRYAVYMMVDEPHGNKSTYGYSTAGWVAAPAAGRVIARIAPMLGMLPDIQDAPHDQPGAVHPAGAGPPGRRGARADRQPPPRRPPTRWPRSRPRLTGAGDAAAGASAVAARCRGARRACLPHDRRAIAAASGRGSLLAMAPGPRLADLMRRSRPVATLAGAGDRRHHRRQPAGRARLSVRRAARQPRRRARLHRRRGVARRGGGAGAARAPPGRPACRRGRCWRTPSRAGAWRSSPPGWPARSRETVVAVTGTNGKTSTVEFLRQIWAAGGQAAASLGTLGLIAPGFDPGAGPDHARSGQPGGDAGAASPAPACSMPRWRRRRTASISSAWTACAWRRRRSPT